MGGGAVWCEKIWIVAADGLVKGALEKKVVGGFLFCGAVGALGSLVRLFFAASSAVGWHRLMKHMLGNTNCSGGVVGAARVG